MSDTTAPGAQDAAPTFILRSQYIKDLSFENPQAPDIFRGQPKPPEVQVNIDVSARPMAVPDEYETILSITANAKSDGKDIFVVELTFGGVFHVAGFPPDALQPILLIEIPRLLFPFARNIVADVTRDSGFPPLIIHQVDFVAMFRQRMAAPTGQA